MLRDLLIDHLHIVFQFIEFIDIGAGRFTFPLAVQISRQGKHLGCDIVDRGIPRLKFTGCIHQFLRRYFNNSFHVKSFL